MTQKKKSRGAQPGASAPFDPLSGRKWLGWLLFAALLVHFTPLFSSQASIQWDAADVHYSAQKYFADEIKQGRLPVWTPYVFSGFPFLADPQTGAFYPLNWPFFLAGITPAAIQAELALHTLIALIGAFLLFESLLENRAAALLGALAYGLSGFFAGHSSHVGMFQAASLLPWTLLFFDRTLKSRRVRDAALCGLVCGMAILAGHLQTALYLSAALGLFAFARVAMQTDLWLTAASTLAGTIVLALALSAVMTLPALELTPLSIRGGVNYGASTEGVLAPGDLGTLLLPDFHGVLSGPYTGPADRTQHYFYAGFLLLPLAALGLKHSRARLTGLVMAVPAAWYMLGPSAGLYKLGAFLPGFHNVRAPVNGWFTVALPLALLAAAGAAEAQRRSGSRWLAIALAAVFLFDLAHFNSWTNPLAYARNSWWDLYGAGTDVLEKRVGPKLPPGTRIHLAANTTAFGPMNSPLDARVEATYGYNPLALASYTQYLDASTANPRLLNALSVGAMVDAARQGLVEVKDWLPRATFAPAITTVADQRESAGRLADHDPAAAVLVEGAPGGLLPDPEAVAKVMSQEHREVRIEYRTRTRNLLRVGIPWYPGWTAACGGNPCAVYRADHTLIGVAVPPGEGIVTLRFEPRRLAAGAIVSVAGALLALAAAAWPRLRKKTLSPETNLC